MLLDRAQTPRDFRQARLDRDHPPENLQIDRRRSAHERVVAEIATDHNSTTVFPVPLDLFEPFLQIRRTLAAQAASDPTPAKPEEK